MQMLHWTVSNGRLLSSDNMLAIVNCFSSVLCNSQLVTLLSDRQSASFVCSAAAAVHAFVCSCECCIYLYLIIISSTVCVSGKKETKMFFVVSSTKLQRFWWNLVASFLSKFVIKHLPPHLNNVSTLLCETENALCTCYHRVVKERNSSIYPTSTASFKFAEFESSWSQHVGNTAREGVQNAYHWPWSINDAIYRWLLQWRRNPA